MALYSLNNSRPAPLPFRITLPGGFTRTDPSTFTADEITAAGFTGPYDEPAYDPATQQLDWIDGAYVISPLPPPPPEPRWQEFGGAVMSDININNMLTQALAVKPGLYGGLVVGLGQAAQGDPRTFVTAWSQSIASGLVSAELATSIAEMASNFDLPEDFIQLLRGEDNAD